MNNEELVSTLTCLHTQRLPIFPMSSPLSYNIAKNANITSLSTVGPVVTTSAAAMVTSSCLSNAISVLEPAMKSLPVHSSGNHVSGCQKPSEANPVSGYTVGQTPSIYTSPMTRCRTGNVALDFETHVDIVTPGCVANPIGNPTGAHTSSPQSHLVNGPAAVYSVRDQLPGNPQLKQHVYSPPGCSISLSVNPRTILFKIL